MLLLSFASCFFADFLVKTGLLCLAAVERCNCYFSFLLVRKSLAILTRLSLRSSFFSVRVSLIDARFSLKPEIWLTISSYESFAFMKGASSASLNEKSSYNEFNHSCSVCWNFSYFILVSSAWEVCCYTSFWLKWWLLHYLIIVLVYTLSAALFLSFSFFIGAKIFTYFYFWLFSGLNDDYCLLVSNFTEYEPFF